MNIVATSSCNMLANMHGIKIFMRNFSTYCCIPMHSYNLCEICYFQTGLISHDFMLNCINFTLVFLLIFCHYFIMLNYHYGSFFIPADDEKVKDIFIFFLCLKISRLTSVLCTQSFLPSITYLNLEEMIFHRCITCVARMLTLYYRPFLASHCCSCCMKGA